MGGEVTRGPRAGTLHPRAHLGPSAVGGGGPRTVLESRGGNGGRWGGQAHVASRDPGLRRELRARGVSLGTSSLKFHGDGETSHSSLRRVTVKARGGGRGSQTQGAGRPLQVEGSGWRKHPTRGCDRAQF